MKTQIDLKSALCGLGIGLLAMLAVGAGTASNETGRYEAAISGNIAMVIDTHTGKVWTKCWSGAAEFQTDTDVFQPKEPAIPLTN